MAGGPERKGAAGHRERARMLLDIGRPREAAAEASAAIAAEPQEPRGHCLLAQALLALREYPAAYAAATKAIGADPAGEWGHRLAALILLREPASGAGTAHDHAAEALRLAPFLAQTHHVMSAVLLQEGDRSGALAHARRELELAPGSPGGHRSVGRALLEQGHWREAEASFRAALRLEPTDSTTLNDLGRVLLRRGRRRAAVGAMGAAAAADPSNPVPLENLRRMMRRDRFPWNPFNGPMPIMVLVPFIALAPVLGLWRRRWYAALPRSVRDQLFFERWTGLGAWMPRLTAAIALVLPAAWSTDGSPWGGLPLWGYCLIAWAAGAALVAYLVWRYLGYRAHASLAAAAIFTDDSLVAEGPRRHLSLPPAIPVAAASIAVLASLGFWSVQAHGFVPRPSLASTPSDGGVSSGSVVLSPDNYPGVSFIPGPHASLAPDGRLVVREPAPPPSSGFSDDFPFLAAMVAVSVVVMRLWWWAKRRIT